MTPEPESTSPIAEDLVRRRAADAEFLGLVAAPGDGRFRFVVEDRLSRLDARLYGGTAIAVSVAAAEQVTDRPALWITTQFVSTVSKGATIDVHVEVLAPGKRTNQVRVTGTDADGGVVFASLGATGHHRDGGLNGEFEQFPTVEPPTDGEEWATPFSGMARAAGFDPETIPALPRDVGFSAVIDMRAATVVDHPDDGPGRVCLWLRRRDRQPVTPALAAYMADMVPMSVAFACRTFALGTSLDNSIRIGRFIDSEWVLIDLRPHLAVGDYGHGTAHIWSADGHLMATASQTASMRSVDLSQVPWAKRSSSS
ncbi:MAG: thioesterase family protein [Acidimicrobiia bacterium]|nr:thioesterase family protein [Acidimicrobiia bacterium]